MADQPTIPAPPSDHPFTRSDGTAVTADAPPFVELSPRRVAVNDPLVGLPGTGQRIDDFELLAELGSGAFARVYLARQVSLGRLVALKVSRNESQEARTLASLEHDHIVRVFSEAVDRDRNLRLLCMQYVPGTTLDRVITALHDLPPERRTGQAILEVVDVQSTAPAALDLAALRGREALAEMDPVEAGCWIGARLAEALAHAHGQDVLHRDIKPANVLVNRYGRPFLADFNVSTPGKNGTGREGTFGGTLAYMAPEHIDAFNPKDFTPANAADARSDVYSLGVLLYQFFSGTFPFPPPQQDLEVSEALWKMAGERRAGAPPLSEAWPEAPASLERVIARCLAPSPQDRFASAADLAAALDSCRELHHMQRHLPPGYWLTPRAVRHPFLVGAILILVPQVLAAVLNIAYNSMRIVGELNPTQRQAFWLMVAAYNAVAWPFCLGKLFSLVSPVLQTWRQLSRGGPVDADEVNRVRRRSLTLSVWGAWLALLGWVPGGFLFPLVIHLTAGKVPPHVFGHFMISFTISGLIALAYSVLGVEFIVIRVLYPGLWCDARKRQQAAQAELAHEESRLAFFQILAVLIPMAGAALIIFIGPEAFADAYSLTFRLLVTALLLVGMCGLGLALIAANELRKALAVLVGASTAPRA